MSLKEVYEHFTGTEESPSVTIRLPSTHPAAPMLRDLFKTLATNERTPGGIYIKRSEPSNGRLRQFISALRDVLADEGVDLDELAGTVLKHRKPRSMTDLMTDPRSMATLFMTVFGANSTEPDRRVRERYINRAQAMMRKLDEQDVSLT